MSERKKFGSDIDQVAIDPFNADNKIIGTRMEIQLSGVIADLLLKFHSILPYANNQMIERHLTVLEAYFDPYLSDQERKRIDDLDRTMIDKLEKIHPTKQSEYRQRFYNEYIEKKLKILMNCASSQDLLPGRIRTMEKL